MENVELNTVEYHGRQREISQAYAPAVVIVIIQPQKISRLSRLPFPHTKNLLP